MFGLRYISILILLLLRGGSLSAQTPSEDSIRSILKQAQQLIKEDKLNDAKRLTSNAWELANTEGFGWGIGEAQLQMGQVYRYSDKVDSAILFFKQAVATFEKYYFPESQARALCLQARLVQSKRQYEEATDLHFKVLYIYNKNFSTEEANKNLDIKATTLERMAVLMTNQKQYDQAETYALEAYHLFEKFGDKALWEMSCAAVGNVYYRTKQYDKATIYYQKAVDLCIQTGRNAGRPLNNLAMVQDKAKHYDEAIATCWKAIEQYKINPLHAERVLIAQTLSNIGSIYHDKGNLNQAKAFLLRGIDSLNNLNSSANMTDIYEELVAVLTKQGDFATALSYQKGIAHLQDSLFFKRRQTELLELQTKFDSEKKNKEIQLLHQDKIVRDLQLKQQTLDLVNQRLLTEKNEQVLEVLRQSKVLQEAQLTQTQTAFDIEKQEKKAQSTLLKIAEQDRQMQLSATADAHTKIGILGGVSVAFLTLSIALWQIFRQRQKAAMARAEIEKIQIEQYTREALQESEKKLLRAQMNPHFMFNVLNSINRYVLENDSVQASVYLNKFSRLMRLVLENSRSEKITLENELAALSLYIELEALRFKDKISYSLYVDPSVDKRFIRIPPLMIQPYVENAIWHGLMHRDEGGKIEITVNQTDENLLEVKIMDNGIGRDAALALKSKSATDKKSFGMQITSERLALVNTLYNTQSIIEVKDLKNTEGGALGTKVILKIPC